MTSDVMFSDKFLMSDVLTTNLMFSDVIGGLSQGGKA